MLDWIWVYLRNLTFVKWLVYYWFSPLGAIGGKYWSNFHLEFGNGSSFVITLACNSDVQWFGDILASFSFFNLGDVICTLIVWSKVELMKLYIEFFNALSGICWVLDLISCEISLMANWRWTMQFCVFIVYIHLIVINVACWGDFSFYFLLLIADSNS